MFICMQTINFISLTSFTRYCKDIANFVLEILGMFVYPHQKSLYQFEGNFHAYLHAKNQL